MELRFPPPNLTPHFRTSTSTTRFLSPSRYSPSSSPSSLSSRWLSASSQSAIRRIRCEFDAKLNGALSGEFDSRFLDRGCVLDCAEMMDVIAKKGSWYSYGDHRLGQGRDRSLQYLRENPLLLDEIEKIVRSKLVEGSGQVGFLPLRSLPLPQEDEDFLKRFNENYCQCWIRQGTLVETGSRNRAAMVLLNFTCV